MKKIAIIQSNYIPWKGYFDVINTVDEFILYDEVQYTRRDWRNRNLVKSLNGLQWLTIPVKVKGKYLQKINETKVSNSSWTKKHWQTITQLYAKAQYFQKYKNQFDETYHNCAHLNLLSEINYEFIRLINAILKIKTPIHWSKNLGQSSEDKTDRLINLCKAVNATHYISGPAAKVYLDEEKFKIAGVKLEYIDYSNYPSYPQINGEFNHHVSVIDLIFNEGENAHQYMKSFL